MRAHVLRQAAGHRELLFARLTYVWLLSRMRPHVNSQAIALSERLSARLTDMRLLYRIRAQTHEAVEAFHYIYLHSHSLTLMLLTHYSSSDSVL